MSNDTEVVDESRPPIPKDPGALVVRYYKDGTWRTADFCSDSYTQHMYETVYKDKYPAARLIRILPEGDGKPELVFADGTPARVGDRAWLPTLFAPGVVQDTGVASFPSDEQDGSSFMIPVGGCYPTRDAAMRQFFRVEIKEESR